ncbi:hypothetical protein L3Q82_023629, partial [Scortum barcoo]
MTPLLPFLVGQVSAGGDAAAAPCVCCRSFLPGRKAWMGCLLGRCRRASAAGAFSPGGRPGWGFYWGRCRRAAALRLLPELSPLVEGLLSRSRLTLGRVFSGERPRMNFSSDERRVEEATRSVLLLDLPAPALQPQEKLLIDLTNTPDLIRTGKTCTTTQVPHTSPVPAADRPEFSAHQVESRRQEGEQRSTHQPVLLMQIFLKTWIRRPVSLQSTLQVSDLAGGAVTASTRAFIISSADEFFDPRFDYDFTRLNDTRTYSRGGEKYERPYGWYRFGLKVLHKYEDNTWLGPDNRSTASAPGEWPVSYHGTSKQGAEGIIRGSYKVLLLDLPAPALQPQEKLLIDLTNNPDLIRTGKTCTTTQVLHKYEDNAWLGPDNRSTASAPGEWPVSYHGTSKQGAEGIIRGFYKPGPRDRFGRGIYSTPYMAELKPYIKTFTSKRTGKSYEVVLQNRINPKYREKHNSDKVLNQPHKTYGHIIDEEEFFDPDYDFTDLKDTETFYRGGEVYERPCGWKHYALKSHTFLSCSLPQKPSAGPLTPSAGGCMSLQVKVQRPSALPTPVRRRMSAIPVATPTNQTGPTRPPPVSHCDPAPCPSSASRERSCSPAPADAQEAEPVDAPDIQPFCLEEEEPPAAPPTNPPQPDQSETTDPGAQSPGQSEPSRNLIELETTEESKTQEVLLLDLPAPALQPQEKLLIDLTNTPKLIRTGKTCTTTQVPHTSPAADRPQLSAHQVESRRQEGEQRSTHQPVLLMQIFLKTWIRRPVAQSNFICLRSALQGVAPAAVSHRVKHVDIDTLLDKKHIIDEDEFFDRRLNYDFTYLRDTETYYRGEEVYERPCGWQRFALKVLHKYEDNKWLGTRYRSTASVPGEWPVSYHGTSKQGAEGIIERILQ